MERETHGNQTNGRNAGDAGGEAIEAIQPIDGVGDAHKPYNRGQQAQAIAQGQGRS